MIYFYYYFPPGYKKSRFRWERSGPGQQTTDETVIASDLLKKNSKLLPVNSFVAVKDVFKSQICLTGNNLLFKLKLKPSLSWS